MKILGKKFLSFLRSFSAYFSLALFRGRFNNILAKLFSPSSNSNGNLLSGLIEDVTERTDPSDKIAWPERNTQ